MGVAARRGDRKRPGMSARTVDTVITYLAMSEPPRQLPPMPVGPKLALMKVENIPTHYYRYLYSTVGGPWLWFERLLLPDEALSERIHRDSVEILVLYANGAPAGYYELDFERAEQTKLVYFGLTPEWTARKLGPWLLGSAASAAFSRGAKELIVNTCTLDHPAALPLYQRLGFRPVRRENRTLTVPAHIAIPSHIEARIAP
jgi:GNAT superfamily N-acetyltransferase